MGQPPAKLASAASIHSLRDLEHSDDDAEDDLLDVPPSYEQVTAQSSQTPASSNSNPVNNTTHRTVHLIDVDSNILGGQRAVSVASRVRDSTIVTLQPELSTSAHQLYEAFAQQICLPPRPQISISGSHTDSTKKKQDKKSGSDVVTDFNFRVDLAETLLKGWETPEGSTDWHNVEVANDSDGIKTYRGTRLKTTTYTPQNKSRFGPIQLPDGDREGPRQETDSGVDIDDDDDEERRLVEPDREHEQDRRDKRFETRKHQEDFMEWCERFCKDPSPVKSFTLKRHVSNFNHQAVIACLKSHIRETNYRGNISMQLVVSKSTITVYSPHWINKLRNHGVAYWVFIISQLWIFAWPVIWLLERRYEVVDSTWYASHGAEAHRDYSMARQYAQGRDENTLGEFWAPAVKQAAWARRTNSEIVSLADAERLQGLTTEQLLLGVSADTEAEVERRQRMQRGEGSFLDSVVGLARGVSEVRQEWNISMGWGGNV
ncbi:uncharacterized protein TRUGW13939_02205 [Talaromyces rugulosus]|uniref:Uncharacterized protein n=1 Tax=Talaromyces rugulosus TaxID=121627 RepID=A0A7H8QPN9_TALRU|nr:uncharacterized protein TRUGW13939_02205 [Talaromyces rugulosus]QKX55113.1 hypothetical protein TRUGW13939_02205 [Talaromyces rugulosus]